MATTPRVLILDCEIENAIPSPGEQPYPEIRYCKGWKDFDNMGLAVTCAFDSQTGPRIFLKDNAAALQQALDQADLVIGHNIKAFDANLLRANSHAVPDEKLFDTLEQCWLAAGLAPAWKGPKTHGGFSLDALAHANLGQGKSGHGALAPVDWQNGRIGSVIDYCMRDVWLTYKLIEHIVVYDSLTDPRDTRKKLQFNLPRETLNLLNQLPIEIPY